MFLEAAPGRPDLVKVNLNVAMAAPTVAMYADYVALRRVRDGVSILFGKRDPISEGVLLQAVEISFPFRPFVNQLVRSVTDPRPGGLAFKESVILAVEQFGYAPVGEESAPTAIKNVASFRSNFVYMALHEDDAAIDFFHLDAPTMHRAINGPDLSIAGFKGVMRVVLSPTLLRYFIEKAGVVAKELEASIPGINESPTTEVLP